MGRPGPAVIVRKKGHGDNTASFIPYEITVGKMLV
jgi:hypothetical protein